jgi:hypothetical protein
MQKVNLKLSLFCFAACNLLVHRRLCQQIGDVVERLATYLKKQNLSAHTTLVFPNLMHVRASMPSICVCSIIVASYIMRGLDTDLHVAGESFTNLSKPPARVVLDQTAHLQVHIYALFMHFIYTMDAFGLTILILMSLPCVNMLSGSLMLSICTFGLFGVSRCMARFSSRSNFFFHLHKSEL